mmetsp:Transcript_37991/g.58800  ORF Transcript_37991/g.58800 Transcript_37991/m.58800 type:complete len:106 (+) Transcript_37991:195-512(+)
MSRSCRPRRATRITIAGTALRTMAAPSDSMETSHTRIHPGETDASCVTVIAWRFCADAAPWMISMMMTQGKGKTGHTPHTKEKGEAETADSTAKMMEKAALDQEE